MDKENIQTLFNEASESLKRLEKEIKRHVDTPVENIDTDDFQRVFLPDGYIRRVQHFREAYQLNKLFGNNKAFIDNVAYSLQLSDLYNYVINRFHLFWSVEKLFLKSAIINLVSVHEALLYCTLKELHSFCVFDGKVCPHNQSCGGYIKSINKMRFQGALDTYRHKIGMHNENLFEKLISLRKLRDNIHIHTVSLNEFYENEDYCKKKYNEAILCLRYLKMHLYDTITSFKEYRDIYCIVRKGI